MIFKMAWRNIWRNKTRSIVIILSVILGLTAGFFVMSLYKGMMKSRIRTVIYSEAGHVQLHDSLFKKDYDPVFVIPRPIQIIKHLQGDETVAAIAPRTVTQGMIATTTGSAGVQINGVIQRDEDQVSSLGKKIVEGKPLDSGKKHNILVGKKLAQKLKLKCGNKIVLTFTDTSSGLVSSAFRVVGIYESENGPLDERNVYVNKAYLNELLGLNEAEAHEITVILKKDEMLSGIQAAWQKEFPFLKLESWMDISPETSLMADTVDTMSLIIIIIILFALAFGIINTMLMAVLERVREIGMMIALGMNKRKMLKLIFFETFMLTLAGTPPGILISKILIDYLNKKGMVFALASKEMMSSFGFSNVLYPEFPQEKIWMILSVVTGTALLSCIFPAWKALRLKPSDALRK